MCWWETQMLTGEIDAAAGGRWRAVLGGRWPGCHRPDLRAGEQCVQVLLQLAGRAGPCDARRSESSQTYSPIIP